MKTDYEKVYQFAELTPKAVSELNQIEEKLNRNTDREIVLVAYQKKEKSER